MTTSTIITTADGSEVVAYDLGGEGTPLLLVHATGFHSHMWLPVVRHLEDAFHCYAMDVRGHGASPPPASGDFSWRTSGDDARVVASTLGLGDCKVAGHSAGGAQLLMAEQDHPRTWSAIWAYEAVVPDFPLALAAKGEGGLIENPLAEGARRRRDRFDSRDAAYDNFAAKPMFAAFDPEVLRLYVEHGFVDDPAGGVRLACRPEDEAATYNGALHTGAFERLPEVAVPVRVACGEISTHFSPDRMKAVAERLQHGTLEVMGGLGHFGPFEAPQRVAASIRNALA